VSEAVSGEELCHQLIMFHEALRRLGFSADDIYVHPKIMSTDGVVGWGVVLRAQGKEWSAHVSACKESPATFRDRWLRFVGGDYKTMPLDELNVLWQKHMPLEKLKSLALSLTEKGLVFPNPAAYGGGT
jgi:hypothetical protein